MILRGIDGFNAADEPVFRHPQLERHSFWVQLKNKTDAQIRSLDEGFLLITDSGTKYWPPDPERKLKLACGRYAIATKYEPQKSHEVKYFEHDDP